MKEVLILTSTFLPYPDANGLITYKISKELIKRGYKIHVVAVKKSENEHSFEKKENIYIRRVSKSKYSSLLNKYKLDKKKRGKVIFQRRLKNLLFLKDFPNFDKQQSNKIFQISDKIIKENNISNIIAVHKPYSNIDAVIKLQEKYPYLQNLAIFLDPIDSIKKPKFMPERVYNYFINKTIKTVSKKLDVIFQPENKKKSFTEKIHNENFKYYEYPSFNLINLKEKNAENNNKINIIYAGTLDVEYRNPKIFFKVIKILSKKMDIRTILYGNNSNIITEATIDTAIEYRESIKQKELFTQYSSSDLLINISNKGIDSIPSKIFELFSFGKPIINFVKEPNDPSLKYFEKYPLAFNFYEFQSFEPQMELLLTFINNNLGKTVEQEKLHKIFKKNTINYFVNQLENSFGKRVNDNEKKFWKIL